MLPQSAALEAPVADKRQGKYETDRSDTPVRNIVEGRFQGKPALKRHKALTGMLSRADSRERPAPNEGSKKGSGKIGLRPALSILPLNGEVSRAI